MENSTKYVAIGFIILFFMMKTSLVHADKNEIDFTRAIGLYNEKSYDRAERIFSRLPGYKARIGNALSVYMQSKPVRAKFIFLSSVILADTDRQRFTALYNAASCAFINGNFSEAKKLYDDALKYRKDNETKHFMLLSARLEKLLLTELDKKKPNPNNKKSGGGKRSVSLDEAMFDREASISMEDVNENKQDSRKTFEFESNSAVINELLQKGINAISLNTSSLDNKLINYSAQNPVTSGHLNKSEYTPLTASDDLWRRIFELEYNIPSALDKKENTQGFRQW